MRTGSTVKLHSTSYKFDTNRISGYRMPKIVMMVLDEISKMTAAVDLLEDVND